MSAGASPCGCLPVERIGRAEVHGDFTVATGAGRRTSADAFLEGYGGNASVFAKRIIKDGVVTCEDDRVGIFGDLLKSRDSVCRFFGGLS